MASIKRLYEEVLSVEFKQSKEQYREFVAHALLQNTPHCGLEQKAQMFELLSDFINELARPDGTVAFNESFFNNFDYFMEELQSQAVSIEGELEMLEDDDLVNIGDYGDRKLVYELTADFLPELSILTASYIIRESN